MNLDLVTTEPISITQTEVLVNAFLAGRSKNTLDAYRRDIRDFCTWLGAGSNERAALILLARGHGEANRIALEYRSYLFEERGLQAVTVNRRLAALRSLVKMARTIGLIPWTLEIQNIKVEKYRDTRGPGIDAVQQMLDCLSGKRPKDLRDKAALRLLFDLSLRRAEVVSINLEDLDLDRQALFVKRKGRTQKEMLSLPNPTVITIRDLRDWLASQGIETGPLFRNFDRAGKGLRLTGTSLYRVVRRLAERIGVETSPHGLRHTGISTAARKAQARGYRQRQVIQYSGHKNSATLDAYIDQVENVQGKIAALVAAELM